MAESNFFFPPLPDSPPPGRVRQESTGSEELTESSKRPREGRGISGERSSDYPCGGGAEREREGGSFHVSFLICVLGVSFNAKLFTHTSQRDVQIGNHARAKLAPKSALVVHQSRQT